MRWPREFQEPSTIWFFASSFVIFLILSVLMEIDRGFLQGLISDDLALQLGLTGQYNRNSGNWLAEDSPMDYLTFALAAFSGIFLFVAFVRCRNAQIFPKPSNSIIMGLLVFLMVFYAGEEISWGQRIFSFGTPAFMEMNKQHEFSVHNLPYVHSYKDGLLAIGILIWGVILPVAKIYFPLVRKIQSVLWMPLPPVRYVGFFAAAIGFRLVFKTLYGNAGQEGLEFLFALAMFLLSLHAVYKPRDLFD